MKKLSVTLLLAAFAAAPAVADIVYVTAMTPNCSATTICGNGLNQTVNSQGNKVYLEEGGFGGYTSAKSSVADRVIVPGSWYHVAAFSNTTANAGIVLAPELGTNGGIYKLYHVFNGTYDNASMDVVVAATSVSNCALSFTTTDKFQRNYGKPAPQVWQLLGFVTNNVDSRFPVIRLYHGGGLANSSGNRVITEQFKFEYYDPCTDVPKVSVSGPLSTTSDQVLVRTVTNATKITVWQDSGSGMVQIGTKTSGIVDGNNYVTVTGLVKGAKVAATQTVNGVDGCKPQDGFGVLVGGGANPKLRLALNIKENPTATGPAGANGGPGANSQIFFVPCSSRSGDSPQADTISITPSTSWQTVTVNLGRQGIGSSGNVTGAAADDTGIGAYVANDTVAIQVYAFKTVGATTVYSATGAESSVVTSNAAFVANWSWDAVSGAEGYRLLRNFNSAGFTQYQDVGAVTSLADPGNPWVDGTTVTPTKAQTTPSFMWNPTAALTNISTAWGVLESIAFVSDDATDNGPLNIYIDDLANDGVVFQDFEGFAAGTLAGRVFNQPGYSGTTSGYILPTPDDASIVNEAAYSGKRSQRVRWQWGSGALNEWLRFNTYNTSVMPNPLVNLDKDISFKLLVLPVGANPVPPLDSVRITSITASEIQYTGGTYSGFGGVQYVLYESTDVAKPLSEWTRTTQINTASPGSFTITPSGTQKFYSIKSEYQPL